MKFLLKVWNLLPGIIGLVQSLLPIVKELVVSVVRIIAVLPFLWSVDDPIIEKVDEWYDNIYGAVEKFKNFLLILR